jgi:hypothetical protein
MRKYRIMEFESIDIFAVTVREKMFINTHINQKIIKRRSHCM